MRLILKTKVLIYQSKATADVKISFQNHELAEYSESFCLEDQLQIDNMMRKQESYANDSDTEGAFICSDGNAVNFTNWNSGDPM